MGKETSERIQTSVLNAAEKKVLVWLAQRQPAWVTSDFLTYTGVVGALVCAFLTLARVPSRLSPYQLITNPREEIHR